MSLDTKYRPYRYADVLGQKGTIQILKQYVKTGAGFHQSYLFAGQFGSGKTTLARVLARSLLCQSPVEGEPCDNCSSCKSFLETGGSDAFVEVDAATNSGKADIQKILEEISYSTFSGTQRVYILDESHNLSPSALDSLLKPLEENIPGTDNKRLVCIFCTTEPEKMKATILSRCAPAFVVESTTPEMIAERLQEICLKEQIPCEREALLMIAERAECHIRDCLKAVEGVSMLGGVTVPTVTKYLHLDINKTYLALLDALSQPSFTEAANLLKTLQTKTSPVTCYERIAEVSLLAYKFWQKLDIVIPSYWDKEHLQKVGDSLQLRLLAVAERFASRPGKPSFAALECDLLTIHRGASVPFAAPQVVYIPQPVQQTLPIAPSAGTPLTVQEMPPSETPSAIDPPIVNSTPIVISSPSDKPMAKPHNVGTVKMVGGVAIHPHAQKQVPKVEGPKGVETTQLTPEFFGQLVSNTLAELLDGGQTR